MAHGARTFRTLPDKPTYCTHTLFQGRAQTRSVDALLRASCKHTSSFMHLWLKYPLTFFLFSDVLRDFHLDTNYRTIEKQRFLGGAFVPPPPHTHTQTVAYSKVRTPDLYFAPPPSLSGSRLQNISLILRPFSFFIGM